TRAPKRLRRAGRRARKGPAAASACRRTVSCHCEARARELKHSDDVSLRGALFAVARRSRSKLTLRVIARSGFRDEAIWPRLLRTFGPRNDTSLRSGQAPQSDTTCRLRRRRAPKDLVEIPRDARDDSCAGRLLPAALRSRLKAHTLAMTLSAYSS